MKKNHAYASPFMRIIEKLDDSEAHYVFAGYYSDDEGQYEIRWSGGDLLTAMLLLGKSFGYGTVFSFCEIELLDCANRSQNFETQLAYEIRELAEETTDHDFSLLWTPPGDWNPRLIHSQHWDYDRVRDELYRSVRRGLKYIHEERIEIDRPAIANTPFQTAKGLVFHGWD